MRPLHDIKILPGLFTIKTDRGADGRWKDGDKVRFHKGLPEKIGGWQKSGAATFTGVCRRLTDWRSLSLEKLIGIATNLKLHIWSSGTIYDVTPLDTSGTLALDPFTTTDTLPSVNVQHTAHGRSVGDYVHFSGATAVGGITVDGEYAVTTVVDADNYTITHSANATSSATGGGAAVAYEYELPVGAEDSIYGLGWGAGAYGASTFGTPRTISNFLVQARIWSMDQWGEDLIACPRGYGIYVWDASAGGLTRATSVAGAPSSAKAILVSMENKHLIALGAHNGTTDDPLLVRWCSSEDYTGWTPSSTNSAGQKRLNTGNEILCGIKGNKEILIHTDSYLWSMTFIGPPYQFAFRPIGANGAMRGPNAGAQLDGVNYWMGEKDFFYYDGTIKVLPCDVYPTVFDDLNFAQRIKTYAGVNRAFGEIWWFYCSGSSDEIDRYVIFNKNERVWSFGTIVRSAYIGDSDVFSVPFAAGVNGYLYDHETGVDADASAMTSYIESGDTELTPGDDMMQIGMMVPDFKRLVGSISLTLKTRKYPQGAQSSSDAITITSSTEYFNPRKKGRQVALRYDSSAVGDDWRIGTIRAALRPHGKK